MAAAHKWSKGGAARCTQAAHQVVVRDGKVLQPEGLRLAHNDGLSPHLALLAPKQRRHTPSRTGKRAWLLTHSQVRTDAVPTTFSTFSESSRRTVMRRFFCTDGVPNPSSSTFPEACEADIVLSSSPRAGFATQHTDTTSGTNRWAVQSRLRGRRTK